jgi:L-ascorbate metabolism protein UlaG (beta-lactamase superfamily)
VPEAGKPAGSASFIHPHLSFTTMSTIAALSSPPLIQAKPSLHRRRWLCRRTLGAGAALPLAFAAGLADTWTGLGRRPDAGRRKRMERSPQWRDGRFHNPQPIRSDFWKAIGAAMRPSPHARPPGLLATAKVDPSALRVAPETGLRITWLGHSTTLIEIDGFRVLTDPVWGGRASPVDWLGAERWYEPPLALAELPEIDAILISHDHYDHLDHRTIIALKNNPATFIVPLGVGAHLEYWGVPKARIVELDWWETTRIGSLRITSTPARHASGRVVFDKDLTLWSGYALTGPGHRVYFSGDTGMQAAFADIAEKLGPFDATLIEAGEYNASWPDWHIGPEQAVAAHRIVKGGVLIPIHWGLFNLAPHTWTEPVERVLAAAAGAGVTVATPRPGESVEPAAPPATTRWWPELPWSRADETPIVSTFDGRKPAAFAQ